MSIRRIKIQNYRSIDKININNVGNINALVGPNEAGKSNILKALEWFSDYKGMEDVDVPKDKDIDEDEDIVEIVFLINHPRKYVDMVKEELQINSKLIQYLEAEKSISYREPEYLLVKKQKNGRKYGQFFDKEGNVTSVVEIQSAIEISKYISHNIHPIDFKNFIEEGVRSFLENRGIKNLKANQDEISVILQHQDINNIITQENEEHKLINSIYSDVQKLKSLIEAKMLRDELLSKLYKIENNTPRRTSIIRAQEISWDAKQIIIESIKKYFEKNFGILREEYNFPNLPKFVLYSGKMSFKDTVKRRGNWKDSINPEDYPLYYRLFQLANLDLSELDSKKGVMKSNEYLKNRIRKVSKNLNEKWRQKEIKLDAYINDTEIAVGIVDLDNKREEIINTSPEDRSDGFQWFLGYFITLEYIKKMGENQILLLDDPAIYLHPRGQKDFITEIEEISKNNQVFYSTHLVSLFDENYLERIYLVDSNNSSTEMKSPWKSNHKDVIEPIRYTLGIDNIIFKDTKKILFVEGISDKFVLEGVLHLLEKDGDWYVYPLCGGDDISDKNRIIKQVETMQCISKLYDEKNFYFVLDGDKKGVFKNGKIENLEFLGDISQEMEDLIDKRFYLKCVEKVYFPLFIGNKGNITKLQKICGNELRNSKGKMTSRLTDEFQKNILGGFSKTDIAKYIKRELLNNNIEEELGRLVGVVKKIVTEGNSKDNDTNGA